MASVLVRDLDPAVIDRLKARAQEHGRSLQKELKAVLEQAAAQGTWAEARSSIERVRKRFAGREFSDSTELIREERDRCRRSW
jgi:antitoxin FitA